MALININPWNFMTAAIGSKRGTIALLILASFAITGWIFYVQKGTKNITEQKNQCCQQANELLKVIIRVNDNLAKPVEPQEVTFNMQRGSYSRALFIDTIKPVKSRGEGKRILDSILNVRWVDSMRKKNSF